MSREIKFRGFGAENKKWIYGSLVIEKSGDMAISDDFGTWYDVTPESVGQYRNTLDTGQEVYDGDIVSFHYNGEERIEPVVSTTCTTYIGRQSNFLMYQLFDSAETRPKKIIGNVYQNPELLNP